MPIRYKILLLIISVVGGSLVYGSVNFEKASKEDLVYMSAKTNEAECIKSRSLHGVEFRATVNGKEYSDYIDLPLEMGCTPELIKEFKDGSLELYSIKSTIHGAVINGVELKNTAISINRYNYKSITVVFIVFVTVISLLATFFKGRAVSRKIN